MNQALGRVITPLENNIGIHVINVAIKKINDLSIENFDSPKIFTPN